MNKSIFDQYKSVNEGILSESQFLRNVKMALPKFISNTTTFKDAITILKNKGIIVEAKEANPMDYGMPNDWCDPQEYDLGMRYELSKGTNEEKASKIVYKNLADRKYYYSQLHLAGYNEDAMKVDRKKRTDLETPVGKDNFVDTINGDKKVKMDKLTEDEMIVLVGNILAEVVDQKKTNLNESIEDNITQIVNNFNKKYTFYGSKHKADMQKIFRMSAIKQILKNPNLTDEDKQKLEAELSANKLEPVKSTTSAGPGSAELYRLGQRGNYTGD
jgi:hypothetical protein